MQYLLGAYADLVKIRDAVDVLANAQVLSPAVDIGGGQAFLAAERVLYAPHADQDATVNGQTVHTPPESELVEGQDLPEAFLDYFWLQLHPAEFYPDGPPPRPEDWYYGR